MAGEFEVTCICSEEEWRDIPLEDAWGYQVSSCGRVRSFRKRGNGGGVGVLDATPRLLSLNPINSVGHLYFQAGKKNNKLVHRMVLLAFVGPEPESDERIEGCHYPDPSPDNNHVWNLRWDTRRENALDEWRDA